MGAGARHDRRQSGLPQVLLDVPVRIPEFQRRPICAPFALIFTNRPIPESTAASMTVTLSSSCRGLLAQHSNTPSTPSRPFLTDPGSVKSPTAQSIWSSSMALARAPSRTNARTGTARRCNSRTTFEPTTPVAPVTRIGFHRASADGVTFALRQKTVVGA